MNQTIASIKANIKTTQENLKENRETLYNLKSELAYYRRLDFDNKAEAKAEKAAQKALKVQDREAKKAARIAKLEAKLLEMKTPKVGIKAKQASKRPSKATVTTFA
jgi:methylthioribose-1-phosphate isomerase